MTLKEYLQKKLTVSSKEAHLIESAIKQYVQKKKRIKEIEIDDEEDYGRDYYDDEYYTGEGSEESEKEEHNAYMEALAQAYDPNSEVMKGYKAKYYQEDLDYFQKYWYDLKRNPNRDWKYTLKSIVNDFEEILDMDRKEGTGQMDIVTGYNGDNTAQQLSGIKLYFDWLTNPNNSIIKGDERYFKERKFRK